MTRITKVELAQINTRLAQDNTALRARVGELELQLKAERTQRAPAAPTTPAPRSAYVMPTWQVRRAEAMAQARALAIATRATVRA